jgi:hypothetical protein
MPTSDQQGAKRVPFWQESDMARTWDSFAVNVCAVGDLSRLTLLYISFHMHLSHETRRVAADVMFVSSSCMSDPLACPGLSWS